MAAFASAPQGFAPSYKEAALNAIRFAAAGATGGAEEDDRLVYDTEAGNLYYDADGSGAGAALLIVNAFAFDANFNSGPLIASDIIIV